MHLPFQLAISFTWFLWIINFHKGLTLQLRNAVGSNGYFLLFLKTGKPEIGDKQI
jgi:hypothetical protein